jgi:hypothetical protein
MPAIDHSVVLHNWNPLRLNSDPAPQSFDSLFLRLQTQFTKLSTEEKRIYAHREGLTNLVALAEDTREKMEEAKEESQKMLAKSQREKRAVQARYEAAVKIEQENEEWKKWLEVVEENLRLREGHLRRREDRLHRMIQRSPSSETDVGDAPDTLMRSPSVFFGSLLDNPPRGRIIASSPLQQHQPFATGSLISCTSDDMYPRSNQISPLRTRKVIPRRFSSANLSCATSTPLLARSGSNVRRMNAFGVAADSLDGSSGSEDEGSDISGAGVEEISHVERSRGRSVRRVSRSENLRR